MKKLLPVMFLFWMVLFARTVAASCNVTVNTLYPTPFTNNTIILTISNTGDDLINSIRVPNDFTSSWTNVTAEIQSGGWEVGSSGGIIFSGGNLGAGESVVVSTTGNTGGEGERIYWGLSTSLNSDGSDAEACNTLEFLITSTPPGPTPTPTPPTAQSPPALSALSVTASATTATISWRSDPSANGIVNYGIGSEYGSSAEGDSDVYDHSVILAGLTANTTYHYAVSSTNADGTTTSSDNTFKTGVAGTSSTVTTNTVTNVVTNTNTQTINQTVILADKSKPTVNVSTKLQKTYKEAPIVEGKVVDTGAINAGIAKIQYSIDDGKNWLMVEEPNGARSASFNFVPEIYDDGNYVLLVKATDLTGNTGVSSKQTLVIDRLPPKVIHSVWRVGPIVLSAPYPLLPGVTTNVSIQAIGGVIELSLLINEQEYKFNKNSENGLWEGEVKIEWGSNPVLQYSGVPVIVRARDGGRNKIEEKMGEISLPAQAGEKVKQDVNVTVYRYDEMTKRFKKWNGAIYGQNNPELGKFDWFLPEGKYYFKESLKRYQSGVTEIFEIQKPSIVSVFGQLEKWSIANFWRSKKLAVSNSGSLISKNDEQLVGRVSKWVEDSEYRGKEFNLNIVASWDPGFATILSGLKTGDLVIVPGANQSSMDLVKMRGGYSIDLIGDPDGTILDDFKETVLPVSININRRGQVVR